MTPRERMLRAIRREPVDRFPVATYNLHGCSWSPHREDPGYRRLLAQMEATGCGVLCKLSSTRLRQGGGQDVTRETVRDGDAAVTTHTWHTPRGELTRIDRKPDGQPAMQVKPYLAAPGDEEKLLSVTFDPATWDPGAARAAIDELGEAGVAYLDYGDPFYRVSDLFDQDEFAIRTIDAPDTIRDLVDFFFEPILLNLTTMLETVAPLGLPILFFTVGPERATPPMLSPDIFRDLVVPYQKKMVALIHDFGFPVCLHCHGRVRQVLPHILECGYDALEPTEPPPQGDIDLSDLRASCEGRLALMGYVQDQDFYLKRPEEIRAHVEGVKAEIGDATGFVCCPTCTPFQHPASEGYLENFAAFLSAAA